MTLEWTRGTAEANGIELAYEEMGRRDDPAVVLIMGLGTQLIAWPEQLCRDLAAGGYRVVRFDNRDVGLSRKFNGSPVPGPAGLLLRHRLGRPIVVPYRLEDMARDTVGLLDALDIERAHVVGASMGGMIAQIVAAGWPERVASLVSIMSTSGRPSLPGIELPVMLHLMRRPRGDRRAVFEHSVKTWKLIGSPAYPSTDEELRQKVRASIERSYYPQGYGRQLAAIAASGSRVPLLPTISSPTLVVHGNADRMVPAAGGIDTAGLIPGARLELIEGMGHDLPRQLIPRLTDLIAAHIGR